MSNIRTAFCFDLDGTVTSQEILPRLSKEMDLFDEITVLTTATMQGLLPFSSSFKLRIKLLGQISISRVNEIILDIQLQPKVRDFIIRNKERSFIVTGNLDVWVDKLIAKKLGCQSFTSKANTLGDKLLGINEIIDKGKVINTLKKRFDRIVVIGDGINDVPMFEEAHIKIAHGALHRPAKILIQQADYITYSEEELCNILNTLL